MEETKSELTLLFLEGREQRDSDSEKFAPAIASRIGMSEGAWAVRGRLDLSGSCRARLRWAIRNGCFYHGAAGERSSCSPADGRTKVAITRGVANLREFYFYKTVFFKF